MRVLLAMGFLYILTPTSAVESDLSKCNKFDIFPTFNVSPCFVCDCVNISSEEGTKELCMMHRINCEKPKECSLLEYHPRVCCETCKKCKIGNRTYENNETWTDESNPCIRYQCKAGVISNVSPKCTTNCTMEVAVPGECCPRCLGCQLGERNLKEGEVVGQCEVCKCQNATLQCTRATCPHLSCSDPVHYDGDCCPRCPHAHARSIHYKEKWCLLNGKQLENGKSYRRDRCTTCHCVNGTVSCLPEVCKRDLTCDENDLVRSPKFCCPICSNKLSCSYMGKNYENLEKWYLRGCAECQCINGSNVCRKQVCAKQIACERGYRASYVPGACCLQCIKDKSNCIAYGDPHYQTFDSKTFSYQGVCKYTLVKTCTTKTGVKPFSIVSRNNGRYTNWFSWIKSVIFTYLGMTITLGQKHRVKVNGRQISLPYVNPPYVDIRKSKRYIYVYTRDGITLKWDGDNYIQISLPKKYQSHVCGLCGNYNGDPRDDFRLDNGVTVDTAKQFGDYWRHSASAACLKKPRMVHNIPQLFNCQGAKLFQAHRTCRRVFSDRRIRQCRWLIPTTDYFQDCVTDVCQCPFKRRNCECGAIRSYYERCAQSVPELEWQRKDKCDTSCSGGSYYSKCTSPCQLTCESFNSLEPCPNTECVPGCECPAGFVWQGSKCVPHFECP